MVHLCSNMQRTRVKGTMVRQSSSPQTEPDFSTLPPVGADHTLNKSLFPVSLQSAASAQSNENAKGAPDQVNGIDSALMPNLTFNSIVLSRQSASNTTASPALPTKEDQFHVDSPRLRSESFRDSLPQPQSAPPRAWGSKYIRHLLTRATTPPDENQMQSGQEKATPPSSPEFEEDSIACSGSAKKTPPKVDAEMAVFLEEIDLESDQDECFESEEAMARILEQEVSQISEV
jgi:hypothetical protein